MCLAALTSMPSIDLVLFLREELRQWLAEGLVDLHTYEQLVRRYPADLDMAQPQLRSR